MALSTYSVSVSCLYSHYFRGTETVLQYGLASTMVQKTHSLFPGQWVCLEYRLHQYRKVPRASSVAFLPCVEKLLQPVATRTLYCGTVMLQGDSWDQVCSAPQLTGCSSFLLPGLLFFAFQGLARHSFTPPLLLSNVSGCFPSWTLLIVFFLLIPPFLASDSIWIIFTISQGHLAFMVFSEKSENC